jgi:hypothetical protein
MVGQGELVEKTSKKRPQFNYFESKVPKYTLPDPRVASDGTAVATVTAWNGTRRGELMELFRDQVYGRRPDVKYSVRFEKTGENPTAFEGAATARAMKAIVMTDDRTFSFPFVVFVPNDAKHAVPAVVHINNRYFTPMEKAVSEVDPFWPVKTLIERGYATASFFTSDVDPDSKDGYADGIRSFFASGQPPEDTAWRSLSASMK